MSVTLHHQSGFTLLEILIALLVLGIGLLGLSHLQITALKHNQSAEFRSKASIFAGDILDRMRANQPAARANSYNRNAADAIPAATGSLANQDLNQWLTALNAQLPDGAGAINCNGGDPLTCDITISWTESQETNDLGTTSFLFVGAI